jgi:hypothetical protein
MTVGTSGSSIADIARLKRHTVGVVGGDINQKIVSVLTKEYDLAHLSSTQGNAPGQAIRPRWVERWA